MTKFITKIVQALKITNPSRSEKAGYFLMHDAETKEVCAVPEAAILAKVNKRLDQIVYPDGFTKTSPIAPLVDNTVTIPAGDFEWKIELNPYVNAAFEQIIAPTTDPDFNRIDSLAATNEGTIVYYQGTEVDNTEIALPPNIPSDQLFLTNLYIFGTTIEDAVTPPITEVFTKEEKDKLAVLDPATMWHKFPWADTGGITIVGDVVTATNAVFESEMVGASILVGESRYIINNYNSATEVTLQSGVLGTTTAPNGSWGIYNKAIEITTTGYLNLYGTSSPVPASVYSEGTMMLPDYVLTIGSLIGIFSDSMQFTQNVPLVWRSGTMGEDGTKDVGLRRNSEGKLEIFDGITAGQFRDLVVRHVSGVTATEPAHYVPLAQMEAADASVLAAANAYTDEGLALKLNAADYNDRFKGKFLTEAAMRAAYPTANVGDEAQVNEVGSETVKNFSWDDELNDWVQSGSGGSGATNTDALPEGSSNLYFTTARVLATVLTGISFATGGAIVSTDTVLVAFGKIQKQITDLISDSKKVELSYALSDETSDLTVGTLITFRMPFAMTLTSVRASVNTAPTVSTIIIDLKESGSSIFSTLLSIDATEKTSVTAATAAVISDSSLADDAEITISTTQIGSGVAGAGLKITLIGTRT